MAPSTNIYSNPDFDLAPVKDWIENSPILQRLSLTNHMLCAYIRGYIMDGEIDRNGQFWTHKAALIKLLENRNKEGLTKKINLEFAASLISPIPLK